MDDIIWKGYRAAHLGWERLPPLADYDYARNLKARNFKVRPILTYVAYISKLSTVETRHFLGSSEASPILWPYASIWKGLLLYQLNGCCDVLVKLYLSAQYLCPTHVRVAPMVSYEMLT